MKSKICSSTVTRWTFKTISFNITIGRHLDHHCKSKFE